MFCFQFGNNHFGNLQITLEINIIAQGKGNRDLGHLGAFLTSTNISKGYITCSISKGSSSMHWVEENNVLPLQTIDNEEDLTGAATILSLLTAPTDNSTSQNLS